MKIDMFQKYLIETQQRVSQMNEEEFKEFKFAVIQGRELCGKPDVKEILTEKLAKLNTFIELDKEDWNDSNQENAQSE